MAEDKKIIVVGDGTKDTKLEAGNCASCDGYAGANSPFVFTPVNFTYNIEAKYTHAKNGSEKTLSLTPSKDIYADFKLMQIDSIVKGAVGKNAAEELMNYYNTELAKGGGSESMTMDFAEKVITEFHTELSKPKWKTFFEKAIKNSLKTENLLKDTFQDYINHDFITNHNRKAISYEGWGKNTCEKTYKVKVNVGVRPKFLKSCTLENDKSRLKVISPEKKFCKAFLAITGEEKELSDDNFLFEVTEKYSEATPRTYTAASTLGKLEDLNGELVTQNQLLQQERTSQKLVKDGAFGGMGNAASGGGIFQMDSERQEWSIGGEYAGTRFQVAADMSGGQMQEEIKIQVDLKLGPEGQVGVSKVTLAGRRASIGYALQQVARNMQGWMYQLWVSWHKPSDNSPVEAAEKAKDKAEEVTEKSEELVNDTKAAADATTDAAGAVANATPENAAALAQTVAAAKAVAQEANASAIATNAAQTALATGEGANPITSNTNSKSTADAVTQTAASVQHLGTAMEHLGALNIPAAQSEMTAAVNKSTQAANTAVEVESKATEVLQDATGLSNNIKEVKQQGESGRALDDATKNLINEIGSKINNQAGKNVKDTLSKENKEKLEQMENNFGYDILPAPEGNIPRTFTPKSNLEGETRVMSGDITKGTSIRMYQDGEIQVENPISTVGANKGSGFKNDNDPAWMRGESQGVLELQIVPKSTIGEEPAQNGSFLKKK